MNLETIKKFEGREYQPFSMDSSDKYLVVGYRTSEHVDVHSRKQSFLRDILAGIGSSDRRGALTGHAIFSV